MTILVQQQLREATERLIAEGENCWPATVERFTALATPAAVLALLNELDQLKAENAQLKAQAGKSVGPLTLGIRGKAFDPAGTHRAYTYAEQPDNLGAWRLGEALVEAHAAPAGDHIDGGLGLLKALQLRGFGVFEMDQAMTKEQQS
ncbi:hypothetical protein [Pseudomonas oryzihabitans]|uniref:hypothetical protein n=1 Tax=Pseudomonas oryzihabitans TaxID=47885 RepID=UPI003EBEBE64